MGRSATNWVTLSGFFVKKAKKIIAWFYQLIHFQVTIEMRKFKTQHTRDNYIFQIFETPFCLPFVVYGKCPAIGLR